MRKETLRHPDMWFERFGDMSFSPRMTHIDIEHDDTLTFSSNPVVDNLIEAGWNVHSCEVTIFMALPLTALTLGTPFPMVERQEFQIDIEDVGYLRFRFESPTRAYLVLFYVEVNKQSNSLGRVWFPRVIDALFRAGINYVWGKVQPPFCEAKWTMDRTNQERLIRFYERNGFLSIGERIWKHSPYKDSGDTATGSESEPAAVLQS